ncbi:MAG: polymer-forming cytoskeletal protein [Candidatus Peregrinibacteria bacterium]
MAADFRSGEKVFLTDTVNDDLYAAGGLVQIDGDVNGDLTLGGGKIMVDAKISQDLNVGGGNISVKGEIGDDLRLGGGNVQIDAIVKDDVLVGGGDLEFGKTSFVGGDLTFASGNLTLRGVINGDVLGAAGTVLFDGEVKGDVNFVNAEHITFGPNGKILGNLIYRSNKPIKDLPEGAVQGEVLYKSIEKPIRQEDIRDFLAILFAGFSVYQLLAMLFAGLFLAWLFRFYFVGAVDYVRHNWLKSLGIGILALIITPIAALILAITLIGLPLAALVFVLWGIMIYFGKLLAAMMIGSWLITFDNKSSFGRTYVSFSFGVLIYVALSLIPVVGWILKFLLIVMGMGALVAYKKDLFDVLRNKKML